MPRAALDARPTPPTPPAPLAPTLDGRAMDNLRFIRETMERAGAFTAVSGWGMIGAGAVALAAAAVANGMSDPRRWLAVWIGAAVIAGAISAGATIRKARAAGLPALSGPARKLLLGFTPPMLAGAVLTAALAHDGRHALLPALWLLIYGSAVITGGTFSVRVLPLLGGLLMTIGSVALLAPRGWSTALLALGFGVLHLLCGYVIVRRYGG